MTVVELKEVQRRFDRRIAVDGLSLRLERGGILGLLGPNGAGKTTTLRMIAGVLPPSAGGIELLGRRLHHRRPALRRHLGYLPDLPPLYESMTVAGYLRYCARLRGVPRRRCRDRVAAVIGQCDLGGVQHRRIGNLSRGFRQRIGLAQAIVHEPALLILDEPTLGLDPIQVQGLREMIAGLREEHAIILSTHLLGEVQALCDRVLILNEGRCVYSGPMTGQDGGFRLAVRAAVTAAEVAGLPGVERVEADGERAFRLRVAEGDGERVLAAVLERGWGVEHWGPAGSQLETLFLEHVHGSG